jgi:arsenite methyltransferase
MEGLGAPVSTGQPMYEQGFLCAGNGGSFHPGGLELTRHLLACCQPPTAARLLDVGCASGSTVEYLLHQTTAVHPVGIDCSAQLLQRGIQQHPHLPLVRALGESLPFASSSIDLILAECSLSAMSDPQGALAEFQRILLPSGQLAISDIYIRNPAGLPALHALPLTCGLRAALPKNELFSLLDAHGFKTLFWEDHSETLKHLTSQLTSAHGSISQFWRLSEPAADPLDIFLALNQAKLGYFCMVCSKPR